MNNVEKVDFNKCLECAVPNVGQNIQQIPIILPKSVPNVNTLFSVDTSDIILQPWQ